MRRAATGAGPARPERHWGTHTLCSRELGARLGHRHNPRHARDSRAARKRSRPASLHRGAGWSARSAESGSSEGCENDSRARAAGERLRPGCGPLGADRADPVPLSVIDAMLGYRQSIEGQRQVLWASQALPAALSSCHVVSNPGWGSCFHVHPAGMG